MHTTKLIGVTTALVAAGVLTTASMASAGDTSTVLKASLDGREEVANGARDNRIVGDPNGRGEAYVFGVDGEATRLCYVLTVDKIDTATAAHIHEGRPGQNGPVVVNLAPPADGSAAGCVTADAQTVAEILADPHDYYVNVHNAEHPGGAVRGQLRAQG